MRDPRTSTTTGSDASRACREVTCRPRACVPAPGGTFVRGAASLPARSLRKSFAIPSGNRPLIQYLCHSVACDRPMPRVVGNGSPAAAHPRGRVGRKEHLALHDPGRPSARPRRPRRRSAHLGRASTACRRRGHERGEPGHPGCPGAARRSVALRRDRPVVLRLLGPRDLRLPDGRRPTPDRQRQLPLGVGPLPVLPPSRQDEPDHRDARRPRRVGQWQPHRDLPRPRHGDQHAQRRRPHPLRPCPDRPIHRVPPDGHQPASVDRGRSTRMRNADELAGP